MGGLHQGCGSKEREVVEADQDISEREDSMQKMARCPDTVKYKGESPSFLCDVIHGGTHKGVGTITMNYIHDV